MSTAAEYCPPFLVRLVDAMRPHLHDSVYNQEENVLGSRAEPEIIKQMMIQECEAVLTAFDTRFDSISVALKKAFQKHQYCGPFRQP